MADRYAQRIRQRDQPAGRGGIRDRVHGDDAMTYHPPQSRSSSADPASGFGVDRGIGERILSVLAVASGPMATNEVAKAAMIWPYQASSVLCHLRKIGKVKVAGKIKGKNFT